MKSFLFLLACAAAAGAQDYDLAVYGGTAGGVITAVSGARTDAPSNMQWQTMAAAKAKDRIE